MYETCIKYSKLYRSKYSSTTGINRIDLRLNFLNSFKQYITLPILLDLYDNWLNGKLLEEDFVENVSYLETISFRLFLTGVEPAKFYKNNFKLSEIDYTNPTLAFKKLLNHKYISSDEKFIKDLENLDIEYSTKHSSVCVNHLLRIENEHHPNEIITSSMVSIEHRLPQTIKGTEWENELGDNHEEIHEENVGKLGNLSIIHQKDNSACGNKGWRVKKPIYEQSHFYLNNDVTPLRRWNEEHITNRTGDLVEETLFILKKKEEHALTDLTNQSVLIGGK